MANDPIANIRIEARRLRAFGLERGLSNEQIDQCILQTLDSKVDRDLSKPALRSVGARSGCMLTVLFRILAAVVVLSVAICLLNAYHKPTQAVIFRHIQSLIYPFMRYLRLATLPLHSVAPQITAWHEDYCLVYNPFYRNPDLKCWPCKDVRVIADLTYMPEFANTYCQNNVPFIVKDPSAREFTMSMFSNFFHDEEKALTKGTTKFVSNKEQVLNVRDIFGDSSYSLVEKYKDLHVTWKFQRAWAARVLRTLFPRPYFVPNDTEVSLQRHIFMDGPKVQPYYLPLTEFANVWLSQKSGERVVTLLPSAECSGQCFPVSTVLMPGDILFYNWQYWKPRFIFVRGEFGLTYMGSYY